MSFTRESERGFTSAPYVIAFSRASLVDYFYWTRTYKLSSDFSRRLTETDYIHQSTTAGVPCEKGRPPTNPETRGTGCEMDYRAISERVTDDVNNLLSFPPYDTMEVSERERTRVTLLASLYSAAIQREETRAD